MSTTAHSLASNVGDFERRLRESVPQLRFISERALNRVLAAMVGSGIRIPMNARLPVWIDRTDAERFGVPPSVLQGAEARILLLTPPDDRLLYDLNDATRLSAYRRLLDRATLTEILNDRAAWTDSELMHRFNTLHEPIRHEIQFVLQAEYLLPENPGDAEVCRAFVPLYLELRANKPDAVADFFPLLEATDPSPDTFFQGFPAFTSLPKCAVGEVEPGATSPPLPSLDVILRQSRNVVRTAIEYYRRPEDRETAVALLREGLGNLLGGSLRWNRERTERWKGILTALLPHTTDGHWTSATKALYELQALALDHRDQLYAVAPFEWVRSRGRLSIRQPLDKARDAILLRHLAKAHKQIDRIPLPPPLKHTFEELMAEERHAAEGRIRDLLGPTVRQALTQAGLVPGNRVELVARDKLVAELLDVVCSRGFFRLSDLRDALARNDIKLADLSGPREWLSGDALLRADRLLGEELFGIYQRGEVYLRGIQRLSAAAFGTPSGRAVTLYALLPFVGAFLTLEFAQHILHAVLRVGLLLAQEPTLEPHEHHHGPHLVHWWSMVLVGGAYLMLLNSPTFRRHCLSGLRSLGTVLRTVIVTLPQAVWSSRIVQALIRNPVATFLWQNVAIPFVIGVVVSAVAILYDLPPHQAFLVGAVSFLSTVLVLRSPAGRLLYEQVSEGLLDAGRYVWASLIPGIISWIVWIFREVAAVVEKVLYTVDEWLRFREGQSKESLVFKTLVAIVWFPISYVVRFVFYLLVEPQVNPVKHFPVVTVSHKVIWPMVPQISTLTGLSDWTVAMMVNGVPGIFGFIAWELKENWRLYGSNRAENLRPVPIGHHGETVRGLLRPGFHSGTVPKIYHRLRTFHDLPASPASKLARAHRELHHTAEYVQRLVERELLPLLVEPGVSVEHVTLGCQRIEVVVKSSVASEPMVLGWELIDDEVVADVARRGWLARDEGGRAKTILTAVAGLNAKAAVTTPEPPAWDDWVKRWGENTAAT